MLVGGSTRDHLRSLCHRADMCEELSFSTLGQTFSARHTYSKLDARRLRQASKLSLLDGVVTEVQLRSYRFHVLMVQLLDRFCWSYYACVSCLMILLSSIHTRFANIATNKHCQERHYLHVIVSAELTPRWLLLVSIYQSQWPSVRTITETQRCGGHDHVRSFCIVKST